MRIFIPQSEADCVAGCVADCVARCVAWINFPEQSGKQSRLPSADFLVAFNKKRTDDRKGWINGADEDGFVREDFGALGYFDCHTKLLMNNESLTIYLLKMMSQTKH